MSRRHRHHSASARKTASDLDRTMTVASQPLTLEDIVNLVHFLASLGPDPSSSK
jgi:hypothetical protein